MQVVDPNIDSKVFALIYGGSGTGKTHLVGTLGELGTVLVIDVDNGYKTLTSPGVPGITQKMRDNIVIVSFDKFDDLTQAANLTIANDPVQWSKVLGIKITKPFDWIVWDTWSELQWKMLQELRKNESLLSGNMGKKLEFRKNIGIQHWGMMTDLNKLAIETLREATKQHQKVNQVFVMQEKVSKNEDLGTVEKGPAIHGQMMTEMPSYFDIVVRTTAAGATGVYSATTKHKAGWPAKSRIGAGKDYTDPTMKKILEVA